MTDCHLCAFVFVETTTVQEVRVEDVGSGNVSDEVSQICEAGDSDNHGIMSLFLTIELCNGM